MAVSSKKYALIITTDTEFAEKSKRAIAASCDNIQCVVTSSAQNALDKLVHVAYDILILAEKNPKLSPKFVIEKIIQNKSLLTPKYFIVVAENDKETAQTNVTNLTIIASSIQETEFIEILKKIDLEGAEDLRRKQSSIKIDVNFINPFIDSTLQVIKTTCKVTCNKEKVFLRNNDITSGDISAIIAMTSSTFKGSFGVSFYKSTFLYLVNSMLDEKCITITSENQDAAGELCNQIFGLTKTKMNENGHSLQPALPSVIVGDNHTIKHMYSTPIICVQFKCAGGLFTVETAVSA